MNKLPKFFPTHVITHKFCTDGTLAAYILKKLNRAASLPDPHITSLRPNERLPDMFLKKNDYRVVMVDLSLGVEILKKASENCQDFIVLDHHESARQEIGHLPFVYFDNKKCGAMLAADYSCMVCDSYNAIIGEPDDSLGETKIRLKLPWFLPIIDARDRYVWDYKNSRELAEAIHDKKLTNEASFEIMENYTEEDKQRLISHGAKLLVIREKKFRKICNNFSAARYKDKIVAFCTAVERGDATDVGEYVCRNWRTDDGKPCDIAVIAIYNFGSEIWATAIRSHNGTDLVDLFRNETRALTRGGHKYAYSLSIKGVAGITEIFSKY